MLLPVSTGVAREVTNFYSVPESEMPVIPNAADTERFRPISESKREQIRSSFGLSPEDFVCAFAGGEWRRKGLDLAIHAIARLRNPGVKLLVLGKDVAAGEFEQLCRDLGVNDQIVFAGFQPQVELALASADLFLFPSRYEAFSLATLEAAACGLPVLATRINGTEDLIRPGENGELIDPEPERIAAHLSSFFANRLRCRSMGENARRLVEREYTWDRIAHLTESVYWQVLEDRDHGR